MARKRIVALAALAGLVAFAYVVMSPTSAAGTARQAVSGLVFTEHQLAVFLKTVGLTGKP